MDTGHDHLEPTRRDCLRTVKTVLGPVMGTLACVELGAAQTPQSSSEHDDRGRASRLIRPGNAGIRTPTIDLSFADDVGMAQWWIPELILPGHTDRPMQVASPVTWQEGAAGALRYESASSDHRLHVIVEVAPFALGWVATLTVTNRSRETMPDVVGTVCLLLHASHFFVDPEWKRTYYRSGGRFLSYFGRERDGGQPVYQMSLVTGRRQVERTPRHVDKWGFTREPSDDGIIAVVGQDCETTLVTTWEPTHHLQANRKGTFHCVHANALVGTLEAEASRTVRGCVLLVSGDLAEVWKQANAAVNRFPVTRQ